MRMPEARGCAGLSCISPYHSVVTRLLALRGISSLYCILLFGRSLFHLAALCHRDNNTFLLALSHEFRLPTQTAILSSLPSKQSVVVVRLCWNFLKQNLITSSQLESLLKGKGVVIVAIDWSDGKKLLEENSFIHKLWACVLSNERRLFVVGRRL